MDEIKEFFENIKRIRIAVESMTNAEEEKQAVNAQPSIINPSAEITQAPVVNNTENHIQAQVVQATQVTNPIPVAQQVESFTQEQIAVAMSNAMAAGRSDVVQNILTTFNATCLMQIDPANYNKIAIILREAGIQI